MDKLRDLVGWSSAEELRAAASERGKLLGIGMAMYVEGTGPGPYEGGHVQVLGSGKVLVATGLTSQGQGHETSFAQIVATDLGAPVAGAEGAAGAHGARAGARAVVGAGRGDRAGGADRGRRGDDRRHPALPVRGGHVRLAGR